MSNNTNAPGAKGQPDTSAGSGTANEAGKDVKDAARRTADKATETAQNVAEQARDAASERAGQAKENVADEMSGIASALRTAASEMRQGSPQERTFGQIAESLADASEAVRDRDLGQMASDLSGFAKRNPLIFLGGAALAGFAATRFAKASQTEPGGGYVSDSSQSRFGSGDTGGDFDRGGIPGPATTAVPTSPGGTAPRATTPPAQPAPAVRTGPTTGDV